MLKLPRAVRYWLCPELKGLEATLVTLQQRVTTLEGLEERLEELKTFGDANDDDNKLDAYGHLNWTVGTAEGEPEWMACFDAVYNEVTNTIDYHVVVDAGTYVHTFDEDSIPAWNKSKVADLKNLPKDWHDFGDNYVDEDDYVMDEEQLKRTSASWSAHIDYLLTQGISREEEEAIREQEPQRFNRNIAGDR